MHATLVFSLFQNILMTYIPGVFLFYDLHERDKHMFGSSSFTSRPTSLTKNDKSPNLYFSMLKIKLNALITQILNFCLEIYCEFTEVPL